MRLLFVGFGVGVAVGAGGCYLYLSTTKQPQATHARRITLDGGHHALKFGAPETEIVRQYEGYIAAYDYRTRNPKWVLEHMTQASSSGDAKRDGIEFFPDPEVDPRFSAKLSDFRGSGYDRGHMAPAADIKSSQKAMEETFSLINISPQVGAGFNRDYWARFERFVKELTYMASDVYVITGPLWLPTQAQSEDDAGNGGKKKGGKWTLAHDWIGKAPGLVAVPTHYYKVVIADPRGGGEPGKPAPAASRDPTSPLAKGAVAVGAFVMPNQPIDARNPLSAYVVPIEDLEQVAGTRFFPGLLEDSRRRTALDTAAAGWRQEGMEQLKPFERLSMKQALAALPAPSSATIDLGETTAKASNVSAAEAPALATAGASTPAASRGTASPPPPPPPKTPGGAGVVHICDINACRMPRPDFFLQGSGGSRNGSTSKSSSVGGAF